MIVSCDAEAWHGLFPPRQAPLILIDGRRIHADEGLRSRGARSILSAQSYLGGGAGYVLSIWAISSLTSRFDGFFAIQ